MISTFFLSTVLHLGYRLLFISSKQFFYGLRRHVNYSLKLSSALSHFCFFSSSFVSHPHSVGTCLHGYAKVPAVPSSSALPSGLAWALPSGSSFRSCCLQYFCFHSRDIVKYYSQVSYFYQAFQTLLLTSAISHNTSAHLPILLLIKKQATCRIYFNFYIHNH